MASAEYRELSNRLDNSAVYPESYYIVDAIAENLQKKPGEIIDCEELIELLDPHTFVGERARLPTITDILEELKKPGHDPRKKFVTPEFNDLINYASARPGYCSLRGLLSLFTYVCSLRAFLMYFGRLKRAWWVVPS